MTRRRLGTRGFTSDRRTLLWIAVAGLLLAGVSSLVWIAYGAVREWQRSTVMLAEQRSEEALTLLTVALNRDMKGAHHSVLGPFNESALNFERRYELDDLFAQAFARFPYPESFFVWRDAPGPGPSTFVFNRVDRPPKWAASHDEPGAYPVVAIADPPVAADIIAQLKTMAANGRRFGAFQTTLNGVPYQVVTHLLYQTERDRRLFGVVGFTVNLEWVNAHYFTEILEQITRIGHVEDSMALAVADDHGRVVASTQPERGSGILHERKFPLSFLDVELVGESGRAQPPVPEWVLRVSASNDRMLAAASRGSSRTTWLILLSAGVAVTGVLLTLRALKASADLAAMQSEFVASATHELKTPLALFQLVADTLKTGRFTSTDTIRTYGGMLDEQTHLLERLIDNVLAYASLGHVARRYCLQPLAVTTLLEAALERFDARLVASGLELTVDVAPNLPNISGDRAALLQALDNVIDNAIKYAPGAQSLSIRASQRDAWVCIEVTDQGEGIPAQDRERVFEKFYRGSASHVGGSGLGLAIARRVVEDHGGTITLENAAPRGTTVTVKLRAVNESG